MKYNIPDDRHIENPFAGQEEEILESNFEYVYHTQEVWELL